MKRPFFTKCLAFALCLSLFCTNCAFGYSLESVVPPAVATVREVSVSAHSPHKTVIHIQDVHRDAEAQANIGRSIEALIRTGGIGFVGLEGTALPVDLSLRGVPYPESVKAVADYLLREGKISGAVYAAYTSAFPVPPFVGIDDPAHYRANVEAYRASVPLLAKTRARQEADEKTLADRKLAVFNPALLAFDREADAYHRRFLGFSDYVRRLAARQPSTLAVDSFLLAADQEAHLDLTRVERERGQLIGRLTEHLSKKETAGLVDETVAYRLGSVGHADFYAHLKSLCARSGVRLASFPALDSYISYVLLTESIKIETVLSDAQKMETRVYAELAKSPAERKLARESTALRLTGKLIEFALTPDEWDQYKRINAARPELAAFESFYREAEARDAAMADNFLREMNDRKTSVAILVTGGFHSPGIDRRLNAAGVATVTVVPKISKLAKEGGTTYLSVFAQEKTPLDKLFQGEKLFTAPKPDVAGAPARALALGHRALTFPAFNKARPTIYFDLASGRLEETVNEKKEIVSARFSVPPLPLLGALPFFDFSGASPAIVVMGVIGAVTLFLLMKGQGMASMEGKAFPIKASAAAYYKWLSNEYARLWNVPDSRRQKRYAKKRDEADLLGANNFEPKRKKEDDPNWIHNVVHYLTVRNEFDLRRLIARYFETHGLFNLQEDLLLGKALHSKNITENQRLFLRCLFFAGNLGLPGKAAAPYAKTDYFGDAYNTAVMTLWERAVPEYDHTFGGRFSSIATFWMHRAIELVVEHLDPVYIPRPQLTRKEYLLSFKNIFYERHHTIATEEELALFANADLLFRRLGIVMEMTDKRLIKATETPGGFREIIPNNAPPDVRHVFALYWLSPDRVRQSLSLSDRSLSLDGELSDSGIRGVDGLDGPFLGALDRLIESEEHSLDKKIVALLLRVLSPRERKIVKLRMKGLEFVKIGAKMKFTKQNADSSFQRAMIKIRKAVVLSPSPELVKLMEMLNLDPRAAAFPAPTQPPSNRVPVGLIIPFGLEMDPTLAVLGIIGFLFIWWLSGVSQMAQDTQKNQDKFSPIPYFESLKNDYVRLWNVPDSVKQREEAAMREQYDLLASKKPSDKKRQIKPKDDTYWIHNVVHDLTIREKFQLKQLVNRYLRSDTPQLFELKDDLLLGKALHSKDITENQRLFLRSFFLAGNLGLVRQATLKYKNKKYHLDIYNSIIRFLLERAIPEYNHAYGLRFNTKAMSWVKHGVSFVSQHRETVYTPPQQFVNKKYLLPLKELFHEIKREFPTHEQLALFANAHLLSRELGITMEMSDESLVAATKTTYGFRHLVLPAMTEKQRAIFSALWMNPGKVENALSFVDSIVSLNTKQQSTDYERIDELADSSDLLEQVFTREKNQLRRQVVDYFLSLLTAKEEAVFRLRLDERELTFDDIGKEVGSSKSAVSKLYNAGMMKINKVVAANGSGMPAEIAKIVKALELTGYEGPLAHLAADGSSDEIYPPEIVAEARALLSRSQRFQPTIAAPSPETAAQGQAMLNATRLQIEDPSMATAFAGVSQAKAFLRIIRQLNDRWCRERGIAFYWSPDSRDGKSFSDMLRMGRLIHRRGPYQLHGEDQSADFVVPLEGEPVERLSYLGLNVGETSTILIFPLHVAIERIVKLNRQIADRTDAEYRRNSQPMPRTYEAMLTLHQSLQTVHGNRYLDFLVEDIMVEEFAHARHTNVLRSWGRLTGVRNAAQYFWVFLRHMLGEASFLRDYTFRKLDEEGNSAAAVIKRGSAIDELGAQLTRAGLGPDPNLKIKDWLKFIAVPTIPQSHKWAGKAAIYFLSRRLLNFRSYSSEPSDETWARLGLALAKVPREQLRNGIKKLYWDIFWQRMDEAPFGRVERAGTLAFRTDLGNVTNAKGESIIPRGALIVGSLLLFAMGLWHGWPATVSFAGLAFIAAPWLGRTWGHQLPTLTKQASDIEKLADAFIEAARGQSGIPAALFGAPVQFDIPNQLTHENPATAQLAPDQADALVSTIESRLTGPEAQRVADVISRWMRRPVTARSNDFRPWKLMLRLPRALKASA